MPDQAKPLPHHTAADWYKQGLEHKRQKKFHEATECFINCVKQQSDFIDAYVELASAQVACGLVREAYQTYQHLMRIKPGHAQGQKRMEKLANNLQRLDKHYQQGNHYAQQRQWDKAIAAFEKAHSIMPSVPEVPSNMAMVFLWKGELDKAHYHVLRALGIQPYYLPALNALGNIELQRGNHAGAKNAFMQAVKLKPEFNGALYNLANMYKAEKDHPEAIKLYEASLATNAEQPAVAAELMQQYYTLHQWQDACALQTKLRPMLGSNKHPAASPFTLLLFDEPALQHNNVQMRVAQNHPDAKPYDNARALPSTGRGKWRIGYLSSDLHTHATAYLIAELFEQHDTNQFEIFAYSTGPDTVCDQRARIMQAANSFHHLHNISDQQIIDTIQQDGIDILVDLKGHTHNHRLGVVQQRPAPIQMHYLGYPGTTGLKAIDYFIADNITAPPESEEFFTEQLIRLPHSYQINDRKRPLPVNTMTREACGLPENGLVFCNFNQSYKITEDIFAVWMSVLKQTEGSVLWLLEYNEDATKNIKAHAQQHGIDPARIVMAPHVSLTHHMARTHLADLVLDSFPVCSHTTASDALWAGVPVLTLAGRSFASRVAASLLHAADCDELVTYSLSEYKKQACALAQNPEKIQALKTHLTDGRMDFPLFDSAATTRALEAAYLHTITLHTNGKPPQSFTLNKDLAIV